MYRDGKYVSIEDYCKKRESISSREENLYLEEVDNLCPVCGTALVLKEGGRCQKNFEIAHVFPNSPTEREKSILKDVEVDGENSESMENKIALCRKCHKDYDDNKTVDSYREMLERKRNKATKLRGKKVLANESPESDLKSAIQVLLALKDKDLVDAGELSYKSLRIKQKVCGVVLRTSIEQNVSAYFPLIRSLFKGMDESGRRYDVVCKSVHLEYQRLMLDCRISQEDVYELIAKWFQSKTQANITVCEIMTSYFVQNCDIFDEIPQ